MGKMVLTKSLIIIGSSLILIVGLFLRSSLKNSAEKLKVEGVSISLAPTSEPTSNPTNTPPPTPTPIPTKRPISTSTPTSIPTTTPIPTSTQSTDTLDKTTLNAYVACKSACPNVGGGETCTVNENGIRFCTHTSAQPDPTCIDACKSKYGLTF